MRFRAGLKPFGASRASLFVGQTEAKQEQPGSAPSLAAAATGDKTGGFSNENN